MSEEEYNGWTNYETWLLALNVDNDQSLYNFTRDLIKQTKSMDVWDAAGELKQQLEDITYDEKCDTYKICDN